MPSARKNNMQSSFPTLQIEQFNRNMLHIGVTLIRVSAS